MYSSGDAAALRVIAWMDLKRGDDLAHRHVGSVLLILRRRRTVSVWYLSWVTTSACWTIAVDGRAACSSGTGGKRMVGVEGGREHYLTLVRRMLVVPGCALWCALSSQSQRSPTWVFGMPRGSSSDERVVGMACTSAFGTSGARRLLLYLECRRLSRRGSDITRSRRAPGIHPDASE